jgi:hypothetical protein
MKSQISFIFLCLLASCSNSSKRVDSPVLNEAQMIDGLLEVHLLEAAFERKITEEMRSRDFNIEDYYQVLFDNQFYSREEFNQSFSYYSRDPKTMERLLDSVLIKIQMLELLE